MVNCLANDFLCYVTLKSKFTVNPVNSDKAVHVLKNIAEFTFGSSSLSTSAVISLCIRNISVHFSFVIGMSCMQPIIVPTPLVGGGIIYLNGFFCSDNFGRSIYSSQRNVSDIVKKLVQLRIWS